MRGMRTWALLGMTAALTACGPGGEFDGLTALSSSLVTENPAQALRYVVKFKEGSRNVSRGLAALASAGGKVVLDLTDRFSAVAARLRPELARPLASIPYIKYVEIDPPRYPLQCPSPALPHCPSFAPNDGQEFEDSAIAPQMPYGTYMVQAHEVSAPSAKLNDVLICIIDSGLETSHTDTTTNVSGHAGNLPWNVDRYGHGTHVAGTIAGLTNGTGIRGIFPGAQLYIVRVFGDDGNWAYSSDLSVAIDACRLKGLAEQKNMVITMSLGGDKALGRPGSSLEETACNDAWAANALLVAAAGNDGKGPGGSVKPSYPASYASVISVAAVDYTGTTASFSQENDFVELSAPGVDVLSTLGWVTDLTVDGTAYAARHVEDSAEDAATGPLADGGTCPNTGSWTGQVVICNGYGDPDGGVNAWIDKFVNVENGGGVGVVITHPDATTSPPYVVLGTASPLPGVTIALNDATQLINNNLGDSATVRANYQTSHWERWDGTSMATPHVSAVAALVWTFDERWTNQELRDALVAGALDLGPAGWDKAYGHGLVQARGTLEQISGCVRNDFCNSTCSFDPDCCPTFPTCPGASYVTVSGSVSVDTGQVTCGTTAAADCVGYLAVVVTEQNIAHLIVGDFAGVQDLRSGGSYPFSFDVPITGKPMYLWAAMFEGDTTTPYFETGDLTSDMHQIPAGATFVQDLLLNAREP